MNNYILYAQYFNISPFTSVICTVQFQKLKLGTLWLFNSPIFHTPTQSPKRLINNTCTQNTCVLSKCTQQHQVTQRSQETPCSLALLLMSNKEGTITMYHPSSCPLHPAYYPVPASLCARPLMPTTDGGVGGRY